MESMSRLTGMPVAMRDADGRLLAVAGSWGMCDAFHRKHPDVGKNCHESVACLSQGIEQGDFKLLKCKNNLCAMATPILVDGRLAGNVYCGHFFQAHDPPDETLFRTQARRYGFEEKTYLDAFRRVPVFDKVVTNLIFNAVDAMPAGGSLSVKTFHDDDHVYLRVSDSGIGMSDEVRNNCLNPFFTTRKAMGSGLGLSVVQGVVKRHSGEIFVDSAPNQGTTLEIRFPSTTVTVEDLAADGNDGPREPAERSTVKILVVEDDAAQATLLQKILKANNHTVDVVFDGADGLAKAVEKRYDLVITDQSMPGISGSELARKLRHVRPEQHIILLTGFGDIMNAAAEDDDECIDKVLSKPYAAEDLYREIRELTR